MSDPKKLLEQIKELDSHITRLIESAKGLQDKMRAIKNPCGKCAGEGRITTLYTNGASYIEFCRSCDGTGHA